MNKTHLFIALIISIGFIIGTFLFGNSFKNRNASENTISVTGLGSQKFTSDLISWSASFSEKDMNLKDAYDKLASDRKIIEDHLISKGIAKNQIIFSAVETAKDFDYNTDEYGRSQQRFTGYILTQTLLIESKEVEKVEAISRNITDIINLGIEITSSPPNYFYTKLAEVKHQMIADGTKDAKLRAQKIAENAGAKLGKLKTARTGIIQITAPNSNEDFSYGGTFNTSSKEKEASITIRLEFLID